MKRNLIIALLVFAMCLLPGCNKVSEDIIDESIDVEVTEVTESEETEVTETSRSEETEPEETTALTEATEETTEETEAEPEATPTSSLSIAERVAIIRAELTLLHDAHPDDEMYMDFIVNENADFVKCTIYSENIYQYETDCEYIDFTDDLIYIEPVCYTYDWIMRHSDQEIINDGLVDRIDRLEDNHSYAGVVRSITTDATKMEVTVGEVIGYGSSDYPIICNPVRLWVDISPNSSFYDGVSFFYSSYEFQTYEGGITESPYWRLVTHTATEEEFGIDFYEYGYITPYTHSVYGPCYGFFLSNQRSAAEERSYGCRYDGGASIHIDMENGEVISWSVRTS